MPPRRPSVRQSDREVGYAAEAAFAAWLDKSGVPYLFAEQSPQTFSAALRDTAKRPDFLIGLPYLRPLAIDVKSKSSYQKNLIFDVDEVEKFQLFCQLFHVTGFFACLDPKGSPLMKWFPLNSFNGRAPQRVNGAWAYILPLPQGLTIDAQQPFSASLDKLCALF
jgi:hypothetical protein